MSIDAARAIPIEDELARRGITLKGKVEREGPCPKCGGTDRFSINTSKQVFNCRGCGGKGSGAIDFVMWIDECECGEALRKLDASFGDYEVNEPIERMKTRHKEHFNGNGECHEEKRRVVASFIYRQQDCSPYLKVLKYNTKPRFSQQRWAETRWESGKPDGDPVLYRLPDILGMIHDTVFVVEGEKDADKLAAIGFVATTNPEGAGKWRECFNPFLAGKTVYILADNDDVGRKHAQDVARSLHGVAASVRVVGLPGLPEKSDVSDWLDAGGDPETLLRLCESFPEWQPSTDDELAVDPPKSGITANPFVWIDAKKIPLRDWLYSTCLIRKFVSVDFAAGGIGKTSHNTVELAAMASGKPLLGVSPKQRLKVWFWNLEDPREEIDRRISAACIRYGLNEHDLLGHLFINHGRDTPLVIAETTKSETKIAHPVVDALVDEIIKNSLDVLIVDPFVSSHKVTENDNNAIDLVAKEWSRVAERGNCAIRLTHHTRKGEAEVTAESGRGAIALVNASRIARVFNRMTKAEGEKAGISEENYRRFYRTYIDKENMSPPAERSEWFEIVSVSLPNGPMGVAGDSVGVSTPWEWPDPLAGVTGRDFDMSAAAIRGGLWREDIRSSDWVGKPVANALGLDLSNPKEKAKVFGLIKIWIKAGSLLIVEGLNSDGHSKKWVRVAE